MKPIYTRNGIDFHSVFDHAQFLCTMASLIKPENYLELGIHTACTLARVSGYCRNCTGVDVDISHIDVRLNDNTKIIESTTDKFFETLDPSVMYDMVFIDAYHGHEQSLKDFVNVSKHVVEEGFIFLHDTSPGSEIMLKECYCNDCYKTPLYIKNNFADDFELVTLPFNPGLTIVKKIKKNKQLSWRE